VQHSVLTAAALSHMKPFLHTLQLGHAVDYQALVSAFWYADAACILCSILPPSCCCCCWLQVIPRINPLRVPSATATSEDRQRLLLRLDMYALKEREVVGDGACQVQLLRLAGPPPWAAFSPSHWVATMSQCSCCISCVVHHCFHTDF
jgi:hypothetical protein